MPAWGGAERHLVEADLHVVGGDAVVGSDGHLGADDVQIGFNQVALGTAPRGHDPERLAQVIGRGRAMVAIATGERYDAPAALRLGLLDAVVPRAQFDDAWRALAQRLAATAPGSTRAIKAVVGAAVPATHPDLEAGATDAFARLWTAEPHWAAVEALEQQRRTG